MGNGLSHFLLFGLLGRFCLLALRSLFFGPLGRFCVDFWRFDSNLISH